MLGRQAKIPVEFIDHNVIIDLPLTKDDYTEQLQTNLKAAYTTIHKNTAHRIDKARIRHERQVAGCEFKRGDKVWCLNQKKKKGKSISLQHIFLGPFTTSYKKTTKNHQKNSS